MEGTAVGQNRQIQQIRVGVIVVAVALSFALVVDALLTFGDLAHWHRVRAAVAFTWALLGIIAILGRGRHPLMLPFALMALTLVAANGCLLWSASHDDGWALAAHLLRVAAYLVPLLAVIRLSSVAATETLQESERRFRAFVSATSDIVYRLGPDWKELRQLVGQDLIADTTEPDRNWLQNYIHPDDQAELQAEIDRAIRTKTPYELEHRVRRVDGTLGWVFSRAIPLLDERGEITEWFGAASDITPRREAEERLRAQLARLSLLGDITHSISDRLDAPSIFQIVLRTLEDELPLDFCCICRHEPGAADVTVDYVGARSVTRAAELSLPQAGRVPIDDAVLGRCLQGQLVHEADLAGATSPFAARLAHGGMHAAVFAPLAVEGKVFGALVAARRAASGFASADCDFLAQVSAHLSLATHQAQLHTSLQAAYEDLRTSQQAVVQQERLRALGQLASGIAHDINNALTPAALYTQTILDRDKTLGERTRSQLEIINRAIEDVGHTVARMRMFHRPRDRELVLAPIDLNSLVRQVIELTRVRWKDMPQEHGIVVDLLTELDAQLPGILGVETELRDALTNLVLNAVDAMPNGGRLVVRTRTRDRLAVVEVTDTGAGMSEAVRARCLEPFFTTKGERGTGLGLAMVYGMAQRHGAELEIDSEPGRGTTVRLVFRAATSAAATAQSILDRPDASLRLLLVDDDPVLLQSLKFALEADGHQVTTADGGAAGIAEFLAARTRHQPYDTVMTDLGMPKLDGRSVAAAIKLASPATPVVLLTGWGQGMQSETARPAHVDVVLSKPPRLAELRATLARLTRVAPPARASAPAR